MREIVGLGAKNQRAKRDRRGRL